MKILGILSLLLVLTFTAAAQEPTITLTGSQGVRDLCNVARGYTLSPDGRLIIASMPQALCIYEIETQTETIYPLPEGSPRLRSSEFHMPLVWSPDSRRVVFTESFYTLFEESDLWIFDVEDGSLTNITDDGVAGGILQLEDTSAMLIDYLPTFAPNGDIYFFRSTRGEAGNTLTLQRFPVDGDAPELVADFTDTLPALSIYYAPSVSPDGAKIVFPVIAADMDDPANGLWVFDFTTESLEQLATLEDATIGLPPTDENFGYIYHNPVWTADSHGVVTSTFSGTYNNTLPQQNYHYIDVETGEITPIVDFSAVEWTEEVLASEDSPRNLIAYEGAVSADGTQFIYINNHLRRDTPPQLVWLPLPPDGGEPRFIAEIPPTTARASTNPLMRGNHVLLINTLYTLDIAE